MLTNDLLNKISEINVTCVVFEVNETQIFSYFIKSYLIVWEVTWAKPY